MDDMLIFLLETLRLGLKNLMLHKLRSLLTALGIIFGVAAVITMVSIGEGKKIQALAEIKNLGSNNIIIRSVKPPDSGGAPQGRSRMLDYGIQRRDLRRIEQTVRPIQRVVPLKQVSSTILAGSRRVPGEAYGTLPELLEVTSLTVSRGRYITDRDVNGQEKVIVIGAEVAETLFPLDDPLGEQIRIPPHTLRVVGVLERVGIAGGAGTALVGRDLNYDLHMPLSTARTLYGDVITKRSAGSFEATRTEVSEIYVQVPEQNDVASVAAKIQRVLDVVDTDRSDITLIVPLELIKQAERTQATFNQLMIAIASISLLVGGIGIMNIMLASVTERTREIGIRRAMGATRPHIISQFLVETTVLSGLGGVLGVAMGLGGTALIALLHYWQYEIERPQLTTWSIVASFCVAVGVGIVFGLYPAMQAARQDPIVALRHD